MKKRISVLLVLVMVLSLVQFTTSPSAQLQAKSKSLKINKKKVTLYYDGSNQTFTADNKIAVLSVKNPAKKVKWLTSNKKIVAIKSIRGKNKKKCTIVAKKKGKATITAKVGKKKVKCKVVTKSYYDSFDDDEDDEENDNVSDNTLPSTTLSPTPIPSIESYMTVFEADKKEVEVSDEQKVAEVEIKAEWSYGSPSFRYKINEPNVVKCSWNKEEQEKIILDITYLKPGSTTVTITNTLDDKEIVIKVNSIKKDHMTLFTAEEEISLTNVEKEKAVILKHSNYLNQEEYNLSYQITDPDIVSCSLDEMEKIEDWSTTKLNITYKKAGTTTIIISNTVDNQVIIIKVTAQEIPLEEIVKIELPEIPVTLRTYSYDKKTVYRTYDINSLYYTVQESYGQYKITLTFEGQKTYDYQGINQSSMCSPSWKLYSSEDFVLKSGTAHSESVAVGEKFKCSSTFYIEKEDVTNNMCLDVLNTN